MKSKKITYIAVISFVLFLLCGFSALGSEMTATRSLSAGSVSPGDTFSVTVNVYFQGNISGAAITESIPEGWTISEVDYGGSLFDEDDFTWLWLDSSTYGDKKNLLYSVTVPATASSGTYYFNGKVSGMIHSEESRFEDIVPSTERRFADITGDQNVQVVASSQSSDISSSGGGGGGGGSGSSGETAQNIIKKEVETAYLNTDSITKYEFKAVENAVEYVQFLSLKNSGKITATIEVLKARSTFAGADAPGIIYQNMNIWLGNTGFATSENIEDATVGFRVTKSWMESNSVKASDIRLYRYSENRWNELETIVESEDDSFVYFEASTPGFSPFAISAHAEESGLKSTTGSLSDVSSDGPSGEATGSPETGSDAKTVPGPSIPIVVLILVLALVCQRKRN
jgi:PGF-pre-PGF domain-containing protein